VKTLMEEPYPELLEDCILVNEVRLQMEIDRLQGRKIKDSRIAQPKDLEKSAKRRWSKHDSNMQDAHTALIAKMPGERTSLAR